MAFGQQMGSLRNLKKSMAKNTGGAFIRYIPKNGSLNVRFIQEPEHWVNYLEHYDQTARRSFPCNGEQGCPGCAGQDRKSSRYLANAVDRDDSDRVIPLQMPKDLANRLVIRYERNGTLTDRDFELSRAGEGLDTVYDLDAGPVDRAKIDKFKPLDLLKTLEDAYNSVFGGDDDDDDDTPAPPVKTRKRSGAAAAARPKPEPAEDEDDEAEEAEEAPPAKPAPRKRAAKKAAAPEPEFTPEVDEDEDEDTEPEDDEDSPDVDDEDDDGDEGYTEEVLRAMPLGVLRKVARDEFEVATKGKSQDELIDAIFEAGEAEDAPPY